MPAELRPSSLADSFAAAVAAAGLVGLGAAGVDALWARAAAPAPWLPLTLATAGLLAPLSMLLGAGVWLASWLWHGSTPPSPTALVRALGAGPVTERSRLAAWTALAPLGGLLWMIVSAPVVLRGFVQDAPSAGVGVAVAFGALVAAGVVGLVVLHAAERLAVAWPAAPPHPAFSGALGLGLALLGFGGLIAAGDVGGGGGPLSIWGVLRRSELDLRAPSLLLAIALGAYLLPAGLVRARWVGLLPLALAPLALTFYAAGRGLAARDVGLAVERSAPLARSLLPLARRWTDRDRDGVSAWFGGGDCDDRDPAVGPGATDVPGNGRDEDCSGMDAPVVELATPKAEPPLSAQEWMEQRLPPELSVVVLSLDALRWDAVGFMGYSRPTTPALDALAREAVVFERAYALASYTGKSIPPMMIGKYTSETHRGWAHFNRIAERETLLWERLQRAGIRTLSVQGYWYFFRKGIGFERGWDVVDGSPAPTLGYVEEDKSRTSAVIADRTIELLGKPEHTGGRFFFWTHYVDPHADYVTHEGFDFGPRDRDRYDGEVAYTAHHVGRVIDFIRQGPLGKRTAIIITSDHGEAFGEHGMIRHGFEVWEPLVRVPLLVYLPGVQPKRITARRSLVDLAPTVLDLFRLPRPSGVGDDFFSGRSWLADILGPPGHQPEERPVLVDMAAGPNNTDRQAFFHGPHKLIATDGRPLGLYDLDADPDEQRDLLSEPQLREPMVARFQAFRQALRTVTVHPIPK